jgi:hypothetical protein
VSVGAARAIRRSAWAALKEPGWLPRMPVRSGGYSPGHLGWPRARGHCAGAAEDRIAGERGCAEGDRSENRAA